MAFEVGPLAQMLAERSDIKALTQAKNMVCGEVNGIVNR
jgi:hypothetical protein